MISLPTSAVAGLAVAGALAAGLTGCSSNTSGHGSAGGPTPTTAPQLGAKLVSGSQSVTSAHLDLNIAVDGKSARASGNEKLSDGRLSALDVTYTLPTSSIRIIKVGGKMYAKLPAQENPSGKPYVLVSPQSSNPAVRQLAGSFGSTISAASTKTYDTFVRAAKSIKVDGRETVNGVGTTHYTMIVDVTKLPTTSAFSRQALQASGLKTLPVQLWVDDQGRPAKVNESLHLMGHSLSIVAVVDHYNQPVTITAPPASQVSTN